MRHTTPRPVSFASSLAPLSLAALAALAACSAAPDAAPPAGEAPAASSSAALSHGEVSVTDHDPLAKSTVRVYDGGGSSCTGVIVAPRYVATAAHCTSAHVGASVNFYDGPLPAANIGYVTDVQVPSCVYLGSQNLSQLDDCDNRLADIAILKLLDPVPSYTRAALLPTGYPGNDVSGWMVGTGLHDGALNPDWDMRKLSQKTYSGTDSDGHFLVNDGHLLTESPDANPGDSGGPFLVYEPSVDRYTALGVMNGAGDEWLTWKEKYSGFAVRISWVLEAIAYTGPFSRMTGVALPSNPILTLPYVYDSRVCALMCERTAGCFGYTHTSGAVPMCQLNSAYSSSVPQANATSGQRKLTFY